MNARSGTGCFKCGKPGHWSRDCTVPQSEWISQAGKEQDTDPAGKPDPPIGKRKRQPRPKLTFDVLKETNGLGYIYANFQEEFKKRFKGRGHEAGDLRRLLSMYEQWQRNLFPTLQFDDFIEGVEKIGKAHQVKKEMHGIRMLAIQPLRGDQAREGEEPGSPAPRASDAAERPSPAVPATADFDSPAREGTDEGDRGDQGELEDEEELLLLQEEAAAGDEEAVMDDLMDDFGV